MTDCEADQTLGVYSPLTVQSEAQTMTNDDHQNPPKGQPDISSGETHSLPLAKSGPAGDGVKKAKRRKASTTVEATPVAVESTERTSPAR